MSSTIDNQWENTMANALRNFLPQTKGIDILVGYFYFSGFREVYRDFIDKKVRILVGMDIDTAMIPTLASKKQHELYEVRESTKASSFSEEEDRYFQSLEGIFNDTDWFEDPETLEAFKVFVSKIQDGTLEIRKSIDRDHSKLFIFHNGKNSEQPGFVIMGSSNLSYSGLVSQSERDKVLKDPDNYREDSEHFERCWNNSENITIADLKTKDRFLDRIKSSLWLYQKPSPYHLYIRILKELFTIDVQESNIKWPKDITRGKFMDFQYQLDAIRFGIDRIQKYNGVIIADVVGLWKSIIASGIAHNFNKKTIVICPPHLVEQWDGYKTEFHINATVFTTGKIEDAVKHKNTHGQNGSEWLIIVDEAHKFRNEDSENYGLLHRLCSNSPTLLLTATPFNNDPKDLFALVKLFDTPGLSRIQTVENLSTKFRELFTTYKKLRKRLRKDDPDIQKIKEEGECIAKELRQLVAPVILRRSHSDLEGITIYKQDLMRQWISFAKVHDPILQEYDLWAITLRYINTLNYLSPKMKERDNDDNQDMETDVMDKATIGLIGARYKTISYLRKESETFKRLQEEVMKDEEILSTEEEKRTSAKKQQQQIGQAQVNIAKFMRRLLVRRFESSLPAFRSTLESILGQSKNMRDMIKKNGMVIVLKKWELINADDLSDMVDWEREEYFQKLEEKGGMRIDAKEFHLQTEWKEKWLLDDLSQDIDLLEKIWDWWFGDGVDPYDPKLEALKKLLHANLSADPERKIIVFSEFADTAQALSDALLQDGFRILKYSSIDAGSDKKELIRQNFDAGCNQEYQKNDYDILVATDAISEGYNLHRSGTIINYDIPFNPTRVIQRIGRINRVNKKVFDDLYIYNFFPTTIGEKETQTKGISTLKMHMIHALLGDDAKTLTDEEELKSYFIEEYREAERKTEQESEWWWQKTYRNDWEEARHDARTMQIVDKIAHRVRIGRIGTGIYPAISFARRGDTPLFGAIQTNEEPQIYPAEEMLPLFRATPSEEHQDITDRFQPLYDAIRSELFQKNTDQAYDGRRKKAIEKLDALRIKIPELDAYLRDIRKLVEYDALPEGTYKILAEISWKVDEAKGTLESILPREYIKERCETIGDHENTDRIIYLSEQFLW